MKHSGIFPVGIDWITATSPKDSVGYAWYDILRNASKNQVMEYGKLENWQNRWYIGHRLDKCLYWGYSQQNKGYILIASGRAANGVWRQVSQVAGNVSRLDLQVTCRIPEPDKDLAERHYLSGTTCPTSPVSKYALIKNNQGGSTVYVGSRLSPFFGRIYDKGIEAKLTGTPGEIWRYEVEIKNPKSFPVAKSILLQCTDGKIEEEGITGFVRTWFTDRGIVPVFGYNGRGVVEIGYTVHKTPVERKLEWLRTQVRPTVTKLIDLGLEAEVKDALLPGVGL